MTKLLDREKKDDNMSKCTARGVTSQLKTLRLGLLGLLLVIAAASSLLIISLSRTFLCPAALGDPKLAARVAEYAATPTQLLAILHYSTTRDIPQQTREEIRETFDVLKTLAPCNFLVYGVGKDSLMWASLNPGGTTVFLEEDSGWLKSVLQRAPVLQAFFVDYHTQLSEADDLLASYKGEPDCLRSAERLNQESRCRLALTQLPEEVYERDWDLIMIDAPRGYFPEAPGRMAAIYSAAVMARARTSPGMTHVFVHDVNRQVERVFAEEFLCQKYRVKEVGRLWHFEIPPAANGTGSRDSFC